MNKKVGQVYRTTKWLKFTVSELKPKTVVLVVSNTTGHQLGEIKWYSGWRQYTFATAPDIIYNNRCLQDITDVLTELNKEQCQKGGI